MLDQRRGVAAGCSAVIIVLLTSACVIYGLDDRKNYNDDAVDDNERRAADATAALVRVAKLSPVRGGKAFDLPGGNVIEGGMGLCSPDQAKKYGHPPEAFWDEPNPAFCSGFKVGRRLIATAGHCVKSEEECRDTRIVFKFYKDDKKDSVPGKGIPAQNVYKCVGIFDEYRQGSGRSDWQVLKVDRDIAAPETTIRKSADGLIARGERLTVIGYPLGLPVKIASGAEVRQVKKNTFVANLDSYHGSSGSAVFNTAKLRNGELFVEGILVGGEKDFEAKPAGRCLISKRCPQDGCIGEHATVASEIEPALQ